jgi:hypothetical protein
MKSLILFFLIFANLTGFSQLDKTLSYSDTIHPKRIALVHTTIATASVTSFIGLYQLWYKNYPQSSFHLFNDNKGWLQMDKFGHFYSAYAYSKNIAEAYRWAGISQNKSSVYGSIGGFSYLLAVEVLDGHSAQWGFSLGDIASNTIGSSLFLIQELAWKKQIINPKFSVRFINYPDDVSERANDLFGTSFSQRVLKDYNAQTYWFSFNPQTLLGIKNDNKYSFINVSFGYGAENMYGTFYNSFRMGDATFDRSDLIRYRQFYVSPDIDFTKIKTKSKSLKALFFILSSIKMPLPGIEYNSLNQFKFHWVIF